MKANLIFLILFFSNELLFANDTGKSLNWLQAETFSFKYNKDQRQLSIKNLKNSVLLDYSEPKGLELLTNDSGQKYLMTQKWGASELLFTQWENGRSVVVHVFEVKQKSAKMICEAIIDGDALDWKKDKPLITTSPQIKVRFKKNHEEIDCK